MSQRKKNKRKKIPGAEAKIKIPAFEAGLKGVFDRLARYYDLPYDLPAVLIDLEKYYGDIVPDPDEYGPSTGETAAQLKRIKTGARSLFKGLASLQGPGGEALRSSLKSVEPPVWCGGSLHSATVPDLTGLQLQALLLRLTTAAEMAQKTLPTRRGQVPMTRARRVAARAAADFFTITRKAPMRVNGRGSPGPFITFLQDIYDALEIKAKASTFGREAIQFWHTERTGSPRRGRRGKLMSANMDK